MLLRSSLLGGNCLLRLLCCSELGWLGRWGLATGLGPLLLLLYMLLLTMQLVLQLLLQLLLLGMCLYMLACVLIMLLCLGAVRSFASCST